jgi:hypothetical protein
VEYDFTVSNAVRIVDSILAVGAEADAAFRFLIHAGLDTYN